MATACGTPVVRAVERVSAMRSLIVDGYNVIHAHPDLAPLADTDLDLARARLVELLAQHAVRRSVDVIVVFDGGGGTAEAPTEEEMLGVRVLFSRRGQSADALIESLAMASPDPGDVTVATSDRATQESVFGRGVLRMSARVLVQELAEEDEPGPGGLPRWRGTVADRLEAEVAARLRRLAGSR